MNKKTIIACIVLALMSLGIAIAINHAQIAPSKQLIVSAASSLKDSVTETTKFYNQVNANVTIRNNFASSGALQQQIENGAPVDVFFAAAAKQMDEIERKNLILVDTRRNLLANRLVLIVPINVENVTNLDSLTKLDDIKRIAIGEPRSVPAGQYAQQVLKKSGIWEQVQSKLVLGNNVSQVLQFVESGNAQAGIVYATDAKTSNKVKIVQIINADLHEPILYPIAVLQKSENQAIAKAYVQFLTGATAKLIFEKYGFSTL